MSETNQQVTGSHRGLRIASVEAFTLLVPTTPPSTAWNFARVKTEEGTVGIGEGIGTPAPVCASIEHFGGLLVGRSAWDIERNWVAMYRASEFTRSGVNQAAISAIDTALWDILGKELQVPVYALLGGKVTSRVPIYHHPWDPLGEKNLELDARTQAFATQRKPEGYTMLTKKLVSEGVIAGKLDRFPREAGFNREISPEALEYAVDIVRQIRDGSRSFRLMIEMHARFNVASAIRIAKALEPFDPFWIEEPVPPENVQETREVQLATHLPVATGERLYNIHDFRNLLEARACRIIQPDIAHVGGITEMKKIMSMADAYYVTVCPHEWNGPVTLAASAHVGVTMPNLLMCEYHIQLAPVLDEVLVGGYRYDPQFFDIPVVSGIGVELDDDYVKRHRIDPMAWGKAHGLA